MVTSTDEWRAGNSRPGLDVQDHGGGVATPTVAHRRISKFSAAGTRGPLTRPSGLPELARPWPPPCGPQPAAVRAPWRASASMTTAGQRPSGPALWSARHVFPAAGAVLIPQTWSTICQYPSLT